MKGAEQWKSPIERARGFLERRREWAAQSASLLWACVIFVAIVGNVEAQPLREYDVKAAFLFNFLSFVEWPDLSFRSPHEPFVIGLMADGDPFEGALEDIVEGERVGDHRVVVRQVDRVDDVAVCDILFVARSAEDRVDDVLEHVDGLPVLTVADVPGFARRGGMIEFRTEDLRVRLSVNRQRANLVGLEINSKLLRLAEIIGEEPVP